MNGPWATRRGRERGDDHAVLALWLAGAAVATRADLPPGGDHLPAGDWLDADRIVLTIPEHQPSALPGFDTADLVQAGLAANGACAELAVPPLAGADDGSVALLAPDWGGHDHAAPRHDWDGDWLAA